MSKSKIERRLTEVGGRLRKLREDLRVAEEQLAHFVDEADDARTRAIVSDGGLAGREHSAAQRHADAMQRHRDEVAAEIARLEASQDELLDQMLAEGGS